MTPSASPWHRFSMAVLLLGQAVHCSMQPMRYAVPVQVASGSAYGGMGMGEALALILLAIVLAARGGPVRVEQSFSDDKFNEIKHIFSFKRLHDVPNTHANSFTMVSSPIHWELMSDQR